MKREGVKEERKTMLDILPTLLMIAALLIKGVIVAAIIATPILLYKIYQLLRGRV